MKARVPWLGSKQQKAALQEEINRQILEADEKYASNIDAMVLYTLHAHFGFGKKRLREFWDAFQQEHDKLIEHYQMPGEFVWLCNRKLKEIGVDLEEWRK